MPNYQELEYALSNLEKNNFAVDYIITHCAPDNILYRINQMFKRDNMTDFLYEVYKKVSYKKWFFGHYHIDKNFGNEECLYQNVVRIL